jgi:threonylcarbamoyladenosine tRNA methylthiotransferase MtaB
MQSGCDKTLAAMKRRYNIKMAETSLSRLREKMEGVTFTCDIIVGFPDETEEDFLTTYDFVRRTRFLDMHIFAYSKRKDTPAATYKNQVKEEIKKVMPETVLVNKEGQAL